ncbi:MAG TPA: hypothetical protein VHR65_03570 [Solirubrobacterales bacterium]|jgi:hypothetical protein|nr:hypothetical protein [Solirubrobacterales bacterium]
MVIATLAALLLAIGCGSSNGGEITVQTGSLSKAEFIEKADAICKAARTEFLAKYTSFVQTHKSDIGKAQKEAALRSEALETIISPNFEGEIDQISKLGAPSDYAPEAASFLNTLQQRLDEVHEDPAELNATLYPFKKAENVAKAAGLEVCAESFG